MKNKWRMLTPKVQTFIEVESNNFWGSAYYQTIPFVNDRTGEIKQIIKTAVDQLGEKGIVKLLNG